MTLHEEVMQNTQPNLDLTKVGALQQKRTLAFVNHFVISTVQFLNTFSKQCEHRLMKFERKLEKVEAALVLLETKLLSIPEINSTQEVHPATVVEDNKLAQDIAETDTVPEMLTTETPKEDPEQMYPEYDRFVKMVHVGVPLDAVKLKVTLEGLLPSILDKVLKK